MQDQIRSVRGLTRRDGTWVASWRYDVYGAASDSAGSAPFVLRYRWTTRELDRETGLYFLRARYYHPIFRRFVQEDPIGFNGDVNLYTYAEGNPTNGRDPDGLSKDYEPEPYRGRKGIEWMWTSEVVFGQVGFDNFMHFVDQLAAGFGWADVVRGWQSYTEAANSTIQELSGTEVCNFFRPCSPMSLDQYRNAVQYGIAGINDPFQGRVSALIRDGRLLINDELISYALSRLEDRSHAEAWGVGYGPADVLAGRVPFPVAFIWSGIFGDPSALPNALLHEYLHTVGLAECSAYVLANRFSAGRNAPPRGCR